MKFKKCLMGLILAGILSTNISHGLVVQVIPLELLEPPIPEVIITAESIPSIVLDKELAEELLSRQHDVATRGDLDILINNLLERYETKIERSNTNILIDEFKMQDNIQILVYDPDIELTKRDIIEEYQALLSRKEIWLDENPDLDSLINLEDIDNEELLTVQELVLLHRDLVANIRLNTNRTRQMYAVLMR